MALALIAVPAAQADGDPASDVLYFQDVFLSFTSPARPVARRLEHAAAVARAKHHPIKVAVIWRVTDMGSVSVLFNKPSTYARFLGAELAQFLTGPLVVAMPAGFGVCGKGKRAAQRLLAQVPFRAKTVNELTDTATVGVSKLTAALPRQRGDTQPPTVRAIRTTATLGTKAELPFRISDNSGRARANVRIYGDQLALFGVFPMPFRCVGRRGSVQRVTLRVPVSLGAGRFKFCVLALDRPKNPSRTSCARLLLVAPEPHRRSSAVAAPESLP